MPRHDRVKHTIDVIVRYFPIVIQLNGKSILSISGQYHVTIVAVALVYFTLENDVSQYDTNPIHNLIRTRPGLTSSAKNN